MSVNKNKVMFPLKYWIKIIQMLIIQVNVWSILRYCHKNEIKYVEAENDDEVQINSGHKSVGSC